MSYTWIIDSRATDHMIENQDIMSSFTLALYSKIVVLARTPIQGIGTATSTLTFPLSSISIYVIFLLLIISKIVKFLQCSVIFFLTHCVFQELRTRKTIGTGRERNGLYELELTSDQVACIST